MGIGAAIGPVLMSGAGVLRPEYFGLLPLERRAIGRGLLVSTFVSIASGFVLLALLAASTHAIALTPATIIVVIIGAPLSWILVIGLSRIIFGLLGAAMRSKFGIEIAGIQYGLIFAAAFAGWMVIQIAVTSASALLESGLPPGPIVTVLEAFPTSWPVLAIERVAADDWAGAGLLLGALALLDVVVVAVAVALLTPRIDVPSRRRQGRRRSRSLVAGGGILPATQLGAVIAKEVRQWTRDPWRSLEIRSGVWTGIAIGFFALISETYAAVAPFSGLIVAFMLGLGACNLYGQDGTVVWQNVVAQDATTVRSDVRGRQWATLLIFVPQALLISALFVVLGQQYWAIPPLLAAIPAVFGAACGAAILGSALFVSPGVDPRNRVRPNDANGDINTQLWFVIVLIVVFTAPTIVAIYASATGAMPWFVAAIVGVLNGMLSAWLLGRIAIAWLSKRMPDVYSRVRYGQVIRKGA